EHRIAAGAAQTAPTGRFRLPAVQPGRPAQLPGERPDRRARPAHAAPVRCADLPEADAHRGAGTSGPGRAGGSGRAAGRHPLRRTATAGGDRPHADAASQPAPRRRAGGLPGPRERRCGDGSAVPGVHGTEAHRGVHTASDRSGAGLGTPARRAARRPEGDRPAGGRRLPRRPAGELPPRRPGGDRLPGGSVSTRLNRPATRLTTRPRDPLAAVTAVAVVLTVVSAWYLDFAPATLISGFENVVALVERMLPPRVDDPGRIGVLAVETLLMA